MATLVSMIPTPRGFGDLSVLGWIVFVGYFGVAALCYRAATRCWCENEARRPCKVWIALAAVLVLLGVNKQLDLQVWLNAYGRRLAEAEGWYQNRAIAQVTFFSGFAVAVVTVCLVVLWLGWGNLRPLSGALLGMATLAAFLLIRAISFDVIDLRTYIHGIKLHSLLEIAGLALIGVSAAQFARRPR
jgi:uncharacterized membrane protein YcfT